MLGPTVHAEIVDAEVVRQDEDDVWRPRLRSGSWLGGCAEREERTQRYDRNGHEHPHGTRSIVQVVPCHPRFCGHQALRRAAVRLKPTLLEEAALDGHVRAQLV